MAQGQGSQQIAPASPLQNKTQRRQAQQLREQAELAWEAGNLRLAARYSEQIKSLLPGTDLAAQAQAQQERGRVDSGVVGVGAAVTFVYVLAWLWCWR